MVTVDIVDKETHAALPFWRAFSDKCLSEWDGSKESVDHINSLLIPYRGKYRLWRDRFPHSHYLEFETQEDAVQFVLEWS